MTIVSTLLQLCANKSWIKDTVRLYTLYTNKHTAFKYEARLHINFSNSSKLPVLFAAGYLIK